MQRSRRLLRLPDVNTGGQYPGNPGSIDHLLERALRPGGTADDAGPTQHEGAWLATGARDKARVIQRRRTAGVSAAGVGVLVAITVGIVPGLLTPSDDNLAASPTPSQQPSQQPTTTDVTEPSTEPSNEPSNEPSALVAPTTPQPSEPQADVQPLPTLADGSLGIPDEVTPDAAALPLSFRQIGSVESAAGAFLQNVARPCAEQSSTVPGGDFVGSHTWTFAGPDTSDPQTTSGEVRVDMFAPGAAAVAFEVLSDRAAACDGAADIALDVLAGAEQGDGPLQQADELLVIIGGNPEVPGNPEVFQPGDGSALVVARSGDIVVRAIVSTLGQVDVGADDGAASGNVAAAEQLAGAGLVQVLDARLAERLAATS